MKLVTHTKWEINIRDVYSGIIAFLPIFMYINIPGINLGLGTVLLIITVPYALTKKIIVKKEIKELPFFLLLGYLLLKSTDEVINVLILLIIIMHIHGALNGSINCRVVRKIMQCVAVCATYCVIIQLIFYYLLGIRFSFLPSFLVADEFKYYYTTEIQSIYRASAFFLEPSHYSQYICISLLFTFFPEDNRKPDIAKAFWIILGCLLTTSGIGIALCIGVLGWYLLFNRMKSGKKIIYIFIGMVAAVLIFLVLMQIPLFAFSIQRIFGEVDGYNAIEGRTWLWDAYIGTMSTNERIVGLGVSNIPKGYMTGLMHMIYCYGYIGLAIMVFVYIYLFIKSKSVTARCVCAMYIAMLPLANLVGAIYICFWLCMIISNKTDYQSLTSNFKSTLISK